MNIIETIKWHFRRFVNQRHCYDFPSELGGWRKYKEPVYGDKNTGDIFDPSVTLENGVFYLIASERGTGTIICLESNDGINWGQRRVLLRGVRNSWQEIVNRACLIWHNKLWHLWYSGQHNGVSCIGYAQSVDGIVYYSMSENPVIQATEPFEGISVMNPSVLWNSEMGKYQMWYSAGDNFEPDVICYAESSDGISWLKYEKPVLAAYAPHLWEKKKVGGCCVKFDGVHHYTIYYIGYQNLDVARICYAESSDGITWKRNDNNLLLSPSKGGWDADAVYKPSVIRYENTVYLWYNGRKGDEEYIGLAIKEYDI